MRSYALEVGDCDYKFPGEKREFDLMSFGKDGQPGGSGENADITN